MDEGMTHGEIDRRVKRTRQALSAALLDLLQEKDWDDLGVADLCARANVARSTFYLHYRGKQDLLDDSFNMLRGTIQSALAEKFEASDLLSVLDLVSDHAISNRKAFSGLMRSRGSGIVREKFLQLLVTLLTDEKTPWQTCDASTARFLAGAYLALSGWMISQKGQSLDDFKHIFRQLAGRVLFAGVAAA